VDRFWYDAWLKRRTYYGIANRRVLILQEAVLLDSKQFAAFSHESADIHGEPGGTFSIFGARILGCNVELVPNQRIVQAWRSAGWDPGTYSIVRFDLKEQGTQTRVLLDHTGFPVGDYDSLYSGWKSHYWDRLQLFFP